MNSSLSSILFPVLYGQVLSLLLSGSYIFNQLTNTAGIYSSLFPNEILYHLLFIVCFFKYKEIVRRICFSEKSSALIFALWLALGLISVTANTLMLKSFQYTSGVSAVLITSSSAIFTVPLSSFFLGAKYSKTHVGAILVVLTGLAMINYTKYRTAAENGLSSQFELVGSLLATGAALGFACITVIQTTIIESIDHGYPWASISSYGFVSSILSAIVANFTELGQQDRDSLIYSHDPRAWFICGLIVSSLGFYLLTPLYLQRYSAVNFQISLLTTDIGVYIFNVFYLKTKLSALYISGFFTVIFGLIIFNLAFLNDRNGEEAKDAEP